MGKCEWKEGFERIEYKQYISDNECYTYFSIKGEFDADTITQMLGLQPEYAGKNKEGIQYWEVGRCEQYHVYVENQMRKTIAPLKSKIDILNEIREKYDVTFTLEIVPTIYPHETTPVLAPPMDVIEFCHATRTEIDIDLYIEEGE